MAKGARHAPARRIEQVRTLLDATGGATVYDIAERIGCSVRSAHRYLRSLEANGEPIYEDKDGRKKIWRLMPSARREQLQLSMSQMVALFLSRRVFDFLQGTGFKEDLDDVFTRLEASLKQRDASAIRNLDRKLFDVNEAPHLYADRSDHINDIVTALIREEQLKVTHGSVSAYRREFLLDPYTLLVYKKGLYLAGFSHHHQALRKFSLDGFRSLQWLKGQPFAYPPDYEPAKLIEGAFGLFTGPATRVRILFSPDVARFVRRRRWHPTQRLRKHPDGLELVMDVAGTTELESWILGFGDKAVVLEPPELREKIMGELRRATERYSRG